MAPLQIIMCGREPSVGPKAIEGLKPEFEVIHHIRNPEMGVADLPALVQGLTPPSASGADASLQLGTGNYGRAPVAILAGGKYLDADVAAMREAISKGAGSEGLKVPWFRADMKVAHSEPGPAYADEVAKRSKDRLVEVLGSGEGKEGGVFWY